MCTIIVSVLHSLLNWWVVVISGPVERPTRTMTFGVRLAPGDITPECMQVFMRTKPMGKDEVLLY